MSQPLWSGGALALQYGATAQDPPGHQQLLPSPPSTKQPQIDDTGEPTQKHFRFFKLPGELRNTIYELVLYHGEGQGYITPPPDSGRRLPGRMIPINGVRTTAFDEKNRPIGFHGEYRTMEGKVQRTDATPAERALWDMLQEHKTRWDTYSGHLCTWQCLLQPPLTRASKRFRKESLSIFYGVNTIHLDMAHFPHINPPILGPGLLRSLGCTDTPPSPFGHRLTKWWRAIGDTNLRKIARMNLVFGISGAPHEVVLAVTCDKGTFTLTNGAQEAVDALPQKRSSIRTDHHITYNLNAMPNLFCRQETFNPTILCIDLETITSRVGFLQENGLHVRGLECLLHDATAVSGVRYLPDRLSLDENWDGHLSNDTKKEERTILRSDKALWETFRQIRVAG